MNTYKMPWIMTKEQVTMESETIPGMAYTMKEIYQRFRAGLPIEVSRHQEYDFDENDQDSFEIPASRLPDADIVDVEAELRDVHYLLKQKRNEVPSAPRATAEVRPDADASGAIE